MVKQAGLLTLSLFLGLSAVVFFTKKDFSILRSSIIIGGLLAFGLIVTGILFDFSLGVWFSFAMVGLASASILYQTSKITHKYNPEQYIAASIGLFGAFMLLFWYMLNILNFFSED